MVAFPAAFLGSSAKSKPGSSSALLDELDAGGF
jgi:hypothetical protein